ncbi:MAG: DUF2892 domain-containing protein [Hyphomicrobium sp.]|nr:DUF2892 domain-containing protein [Hyphomicrobium sp.]
MSINVGTVDRSLRIAIGLFLLSLVFWGPQSYWGLVGIVPLVTGLARFCPSYKIAGVSTCGRQT